MASLPTMHLSPINFTLLEELPDILPVAEYIIPAILSIPSRLVRVWHWFGSIN